MMASDSETADDGDEVDDEYDAPGALAIAHLFKKLREVVRYHAREYKMPVAALLGTLEYVKLHIYTASLEWGEEDDDDDVADDAAE